jgi:putative membrane protein
LIKNAIALLLPWEFSPTVIAAITLALVLYMVGCARKQPPPAYPRRLAFYLGLALIYCALQTRWDYYAAHMFFVHRLQHFVLHDVGPALLAASAPASELIEGLPRRLARRVTAMPAWLNLVAGTAFEPWTATALYISSLIVWIWPPVHFDVMLSNPLYKLMNWSVVLGDLPFWWVILDPRPYPLARVRGGLRLLMLGLALPPMMLAGAVLGLSRHDLYPVYGVCGRFAPVSPLTDQQIGGLIIWIPGTVLLGIVAILVLRRTLHQEHVARASSR